MLNMLLDVLIRLSVGVLIGCIIDYLVTKGHTGTNNKKNYNNFMSNISSIELFCYIFVLFMSVHLFFYFVSTYIFADVFNTIYCMGSESEQIGNSNIDNIGNKLNDKVKPSFIGVKDLNIKIPTEFLPPVVNALASGGIMAAAITAGSKITHNTPGTAGKLTVASVALGTGVIVVKNIGGEVNQIKKVDNIGSDKSSFMPLLFESSGNSAIDLLNILQYFHTLEIFFVLCLGFYYIVMKLD
jgi:hypothetical protein